MFPDIDQPKVGAKPPPHAAKDRCGGTVREAPADYTEDRPHLSRRLSAAINQAFDGKWTGVVRLSVTPDHVSIAIMLCLPEEKCLYTMDSEHDRRDHLAESLFNCCEIEA